MKPAVAPLIAAIRAERQKRATSQRALSKQTGIPQSRLSLIESGAVDLRASTLLQIARSLDLDVMLVPRRAVPLVRAMTRAATSEGESTTEQQPLYRLDDQDD